MYLQIKSEICPEYFRNIAFTDTEHELTDKIYIYVWKSHYA